MHNISIYGAGHLTKTLVKGLSLFTERPIRIYNRTPENITILRQDYKNLMPASGFSDLIRESSFVFLIIPPAAIIKPDAEFVRTLTETDSILVSCGYFNTISMLENAYPAIKIIRLSPNINWQIARGVTIYDHNKLVTKEEILEFSDFIGHITSLIKVKDDEEFDSLGKLTACGPALFIDIIENLCDSFGIFEPVHRTAVYNTVEGVFDKALKTDRPPAEIIAEVANKGGITESGISAMNYFLPDVFSKIKERMDDRTVMVKRNLEQTK